MRYVAFLLSIPCCLGALGVMKTVAIAASEPIVTPIQAPPVGRSPQAGPSSFWDRTAEMAQQQLYWADQAEQALGGPDPNAVRVARSRIIANSVAVEQFFERQYPFLDLLCEPSNETPVSPAIPADFRRQATENAGLSASQVEVACQLRILSQRLEAIAPQLERRVAMLSDVAEIQPVLMPSESYYEPNTGVPMQRRSFNQPARARFANEPDLPVARPLIEGPQKDAIAGYQAPIQPAIAPPRQVVSQLQAIQQQVRTLLSAFPNGYSFDDPAVDRQIDQRNAYGVHALEQEQYAAFMNQPNQGVARILRSDAHHRPANEIRNRIVPNVPEAFPMSTLAMNADVAEGLFPVLALQIQNDQIQVVPSNLDYGFMVNLGDVDLEDLSMDAPGLPEHFRAYRPPTQMAEVQAEQRRFAVGSWNDSLGQPMASTLPVELHQTYVARLMQYDLPEVVLRSQPLSTQERGHLNELLAMQSADVLVAFRPVNRRPDGSYTVLWRVLAEMPDPVIADLDQYVQF